MSNKNAYAKFDEEDQRVQPAIKKNPNIPINLEMKDVSSVAVGAVGTVDVIGVVSTDAQNVQQSQDKQGSSSDLYN